MILVLREERITSTAGSFCACVFDDACVQTTLTVPTAGRVPAPLLCTGRPPPLSVVGAPQNTKAIGNKLSEITYVFLCCSAIFSRDTSANGPQPCLEAPTRSNHNGCRRPRLLPTRGLIQLAPVSTHHRTTGGGGRHTKSRRRRSQDKLKLNSEGKVQQGRAYGFQTVSTA